ncbi:aminotransferase class IV [Hymenobacter sp. BT18]|uniref:aminotransferase class IV n=1 Tax=Hymenobacter sp. BT18 TaxID=2835648 RepID=UPI00143ED3EB|nr:aminotransferase class IV [Hymenobacter sp. BT18]QIX59851.1 aminotransferase class IV [Hymenobacter sp. BT18]
MTSTTFLLYNGRLLPEAAFALPLPNRGLSFNDGFFETLVWSQGRLRYAEQHARRMQQAAAVLGLELPEAISTAQLEAALSQLAQAQQLPQVRMRVQLWRAGAGLYTPESQEAEWLATSQPFQANDTPVQRADFAKTVQTQVSPVSFCKGPNALLYVMAARERQQRGLDDLVLLSVAGYVAETISAAIFWVKDKQLYTPALTTGCVAGVRRAHLLQVARQQDIECHEVLARPEEVQRADAVFSANVAGIRWIKQLGTTCWEAEHPLLSQLRHWEAQP